MAIRRNASLKPQLHLIREWVQAGATDIWIAHKLESTPASIARFRRQHAITKGEVVDLDSLPDVEVEEVAVVDATVAEPVEGTDGGTAKRRSRRGGRGRAKGAEGEASGSPASPITLEAVFDHGDEGYGLWLDGAIRDAAVYRQHWAGNAAVVVTVSADEIVIRRA